MKILCIYAHPDDETVAAGGTLYQLSQTGHKIKVILATAGQSGEVHSSQQTALVKAGGSIAKLRKKEFRAACHILGITESEIWNYHDGQITNELVWGKLTLDCITAIDSYQPDMIITFDHTGWYYHLDHIGVSIAVIRAIKQAKHQTASLMFSLLHPPGIKDRWSYIYQDLLPTTHSVDISAFIDIKVRALKAHASQHINLITKLEKGKMDSEYFQLAINPTTGSLPSIFMPSKQSS